MGGYIDRGLDSAGCVQYPINLQNKNVIFLRGNYEDNLEKFLKDPVGVADSFFTYGGSECAASYGVAINDSRIRRIDAAVVRRVENCPACAPQKLLCQSFKERFAWRL